MGQVHSMSNIKKPIDHDLEYLYKMSREMLNRCPNDSEEDEFKAKCKDFALAGKTGDFASRNKAFKEVMVKL